MVPVRDFDDVLHGLQFIGPDGAKRFLTGSTKRAHFYPIGEPGDVVVICEGYATGATIREATEHAIVVALDRGNLRPVAAAVRSALNVIEARAHFDAPQTDIHIRVAGHDGKLYLDLAEDAWRAVEIDEAGWRIVDEPPVRFRRPAGMQPLPAPATSGSIETLRSFLNVGSDNDFVLVVAWPATPRALSGRLRRAATFLRKVGVDISFDREGRARTRIIRISCAAMESKPTRDDITRTPGALRLWQTSVLTAGNKLLPEVSDKSLAEAGAESRAARAG